MTFTARPHIAQQDAIADENERQQIEVFKAHLANRLGEAHTTYQDDFLAKQEQA